MIAFVKNHQKYLIAFLAACASILISFPITIVPHNVTLAMVVGIIVIAACIKWPNFLIIMVILNEIVGIGLQGYFNFSLVLFGFNIYSQDIILLIIVILTLVAMLTGRWEWPQNRMMIPILIFMGLAVIDAARGYLAGNAFRNIARDFANLLPYMMGFFFYNIVRDRRTLIRWIWVLMILGTATATFALVMRLLGIQTTFGFEGFSTSETSLGEVTRAYGLAGATPFYMFGLFLGIAILFIYTRNLSIFCFISLLVATMTCLGALLLLFIRSYFLGLLAGIALFIWSFTGLQRWKVTITVVVVFLLIFVLGPYLGIPFTAMLTNRFMSIFIPSAAGIGAEMNTQVRIIELQTVLNSLKPIGLIFGNGLGSLLQVRLPMGNVTTDYHNSFAALLLKMGILGGLFWIGFPAMLMRKASKMKSKKVDPIAKAIFLGLISFIVAWAFGSSTAAGMPMVVTLTESMIIGMMLRIYDVSQIESASQDSTLFPAG